MLEFKECVPGRMNEKNDERIDCLKKVVEQLKTDRDDGKPSKKLVFILGSGISDDAGIPQWGRLLADGIRHQLYNYGDECDDDTLKKEIEALKAAASSFNKGKKFDKEDNICYNVVAGLNLLEVAEYLMINVRKGIRSGNERYKEGLASQQIASLIGSCIRLGGDKVRDFLDGKVCKGKVYKESSLYAIANVIKEMYGNYKWGQKILTYNYDNLLELSLKEEGVSMDNINSITYSSEKDLTFDDNKINIAHVHGKISVDERGNPASGIILTESSYYDMEKTDYLWQHTVQAQSMLDDICLIVGFSAEDHNFRRIMRHSAHVKNTYIIFSIDSLIDKIFGKCDNTDELRKKMGSDEYAYERLLFVYFIISQTEYWEHYKIKPIWTDIDHIPELIKKIGGISKKDNMAHETLAEFCIKDGASPPRRIS